MAYVPPGHDAIRRSELVLLIFVAGWFVIPRNVSFCKNLP